VVQKLGQELMRDLGLQQPFPVLREHRRHPHRLVDAEPDEPAVQQVVVELLHQLRLGADRVERLQQKCAEQSLRCNRRPSALGIDLGELAIERGQHFVDDAADQAQRMLRRNAILEVNVREQVTAPLIRSAHPRLPIGKNSGIIFARPCQPTFSAAC
jgi:hypothetical protein